MIERCGANRVSPQLNSKRYHTVSEPMSKNVEAPTAFSISSLIKLFVVK
jgi:hypothetical protein